MDNRPIGIFDSGVGGVAVLREIIKVNPNEDIIYLGDTARLPYGTKTKETIIKFTRECIDFLISKNVKCVVIACGTATSQALYEILEDYEIPLMGVIIPTIESLDISREDVIGVIGTSGTISSNVWEQEIHKRHGNVEVISVKTPLLAQMAEDGWTNNSVAKEAIKEYMKPLKNKISKLILGCTHYPLFKELIQSELGDNIKIIDIGVCASRFLSKKLVNENMNSVQTQLGKYKFYLTDVENSFKDIANHILKDIFIIENVEKVNVETINK